jgi:hypothetical protein
MVSTVTTSTVSTITTVALAASLGLLLVVALLIFLVQKEIAAEAEGSSAQAFAKILNIAIVPLFLAFIFIAVMKVIQVLN